MAVLTASEKAHMARSAGANYNVMTDQYVFPDGTRVDAGGVTAAPQQYYSNNTITQPQSQNGWARGIIDGKTLQPIHNKEDIIKDIVEKIKAKYKDRDLIMIKTADLIRFIESV